MGSDPRPDAEVAKASPHSLFRPSYQVRLEAANHVLIAGAGGGFDVFAGLPLYFALRSAGKQVSLANLSFTYLGGTTAERISLPLWKVDHQTRGEERYFPERYLSEWLHAHQFPSEIYCFDRFGVQPIADAYRHLVRTLGIDAIVLVDGGTDILMRGDESGLGTPTEDMTSLAAVATLEVPVRMVSCLGFGIDAFHGVCHAHFLENVSRLQESGAHLGVHSLHLSMPEGRLFQEIVNYVHSHMPGRESIVNGSILSALEGRFGNVHRTARTRHSELFINPLMTHYWHFDLPELARQCLYLPLINSTQTSFEVQARIEAFRRQVEPRPPRPLPM